MRPIHFFIAVTSCAWLDLCSQAGTSLRGEIISRGGPGMHWPAAVAGTWFPLRRV